MRKSGSIRRKSKIQHQSPKESAEQKRIDRHEKLIRLVKSYRRTLEEEDRLFKLRKNTIFEIQLRYKRSETNHAYVFPKDLQTKTDENSEDQFLQHQTQSPRGNVYFDLKIQNQVQTRKVSLESTRLNSARRVKSLDQYSSNNSQTKLIRHKRLQTNLGEQQPLQSGRKLKRSSTLNKNIIKLSPLGELSYGKKIQKIKTEIESSPNIIQKMMSRKLLTETGLTPLKKPNRTKIRHLMNS